MKFYDLILIMILFNVFGGALMNSGLFASMGITESIDIFDSNTAISDIGSMETKTTSSVKKEITGFSILEVAFDWISNQVKNMFGGFFDPIKKYITWPAKLMFMFGIPSEIAYGFTAVFNLVQVIGIIQFITGRSFREAD